MSKSIKVTIVEDHEMTRMGLSFALSNSECIEVLGTSADGADGVNQALGIKTGSCYNGYRTPYD